MADAAPLTSAPALPPGAVPLSSLTPGALTSTPSTVPVGAVPLSSVNPSDLSPTNAVPLGAIQPGELMSSQDYLNALAPSQVVNKAAEAYQNGEVSDAAQQPYRDAYAVARARGGLFGTSTLPTDQQPSPVAPSVAGNGTEVIPTMLQEGLDAVYALTPNVLLRPADAAMRGIVGGTAKVGEQLAQVYGGSDEEASRAANSLEQATKATNLSMGQMATLGVAEKLSDPALLKTVLPALDPTGALSNGLTLLGAAAQHLFNTANATTSGSTFTRKMYDLEFGANRAIELAKSGEEQGIDVHGRKMPVDTADVRSMEASPLLQVPMGLSGARGVEEAVAAGAPGVAARALEFGPEAEYVPSIGQQTLALPFQAIAKVSSKTADVVGNHPVLAALGTSGAALMAGHPIIAGGMLYEEMVNGGKFAAQIAKVADRATAQASRITGNPASMGVMGKFAAGVMQLAQDGTEAALVSQVPNMPFILGADNSQDAAAMVMGGTMMHAAGYVTGKAVNGFNFNRGMWGPYGGPTPERIPVVQPGADPALDAGHADVSSGLNNASNNFVQLISGVLKKANGEGYALYGPAFNAHMDALVGKPIVGSGGVSRPWTQADADLAKNQVGITYQTPGEDGKLRTVAITKVTPSSPGLSFGHEAGHALDLLSDPETLNAAHEATYDAYSNGGKNPENVYEYKKLYDQMVQGGLDPSNPRNPASPQYPKSWREMTPEQQNDAISELHAEQTGAVLNAVPLGTDPGILDAGRSIYSLVARGLEKLGAKQPQAVVKEFYDAVTTAQQSSAAASAEPGNVELQAQAVKDAQAVRAIRDRKGLTPTGVQPSATLGHVVQNFLQAFKVDQKRLMENAGIGEPPVLAKAPVERGEMPGAAAVVPKPVEPGFRKGDPIGRLTRPDTGMLMGTDAKVVKELGEGVLDENGVFVPREGGERHYSVEYKHPDTGQVYRAPVPESWLESSTGTGEPKPGSVIIPTHPITGETPPFVRTVPEGQPSDQLQGPKENPGIVPQPAHVRSSAGEQNAAFGKQATPETMAHNKALFAKIIANPTQPGTVEIVHNGAVTGPKEPDQIVRERERLLSEASARTGNLSLKQPNQKVVVPFRETPSKSEPGVFALDSGKILQNAAILEQWLVNNRGKIALNGKLTSALSYLSSPESRTDLQAYLRNQANGYAGGGGRVVRPKDTIAGTVPPENPGYRPVTIPDERVQVLNALMGYGPPKKLRAGVTVANDYFRRFAEGSGRGTTKTNLGLAETNPLRAELVKAGFNPDLLNQATSQLRYRDIVGKAVPRPDLNFFGGSTAITRGGFMPSVGAENEHATYQGQQDDMQGGSFGLYNLKHDIPGHPQGSTVSEETLQKAGLPVPDAKFMPRVLLTDKDVGQNPEDFKLRNAWMAPDGKLYPVGNFSDHRGWAGSHLSYDTPQERQDNFGHAGETKLKNAGWVRLSLERDGRGVFANGRPSEKQRAALELISKNYPDDEFIHDGTRFMPPADPSKEHVVDTAIKLPSGKIFRAYDDEYGQVPHGDLWIQAHEENQIDGPTLDKQLDNSARGVDSANGFITSTGRFLSRKEAYVLARENGQVNERPHNSTKRSGLDSVDVHFMPPADPSQEHVDRAALRAPDGKIIVGDKDAYHGMLMVQADRQYKDFPRYETGFVSSTGRYLTREEAFQLARSAGQVAQRNNMSEGLNTEAVRAAGDRFMPSVEEGAVPEKELKLVHYGSPGMTHVDPARFGRSGLTSRSELAGEPRGYFYEQGKENREDPAALRKDVYSTTVSGSSIYDGDRDPLGYKRMINRSAADLFLQEKGFKGIRRTVINGAGKPYSQVEMYDKTPVTPLAAGKGKYMWDLPTIKQLNEEKLQNLDPETETSRQSSYAGNDKMGLVLHSAKQRSTTFIPPGKLAKEFLKTHGALANEKAQDKHIESHFMPDVTRTIEKPEFKKWFEGSKAIDQDGNPAVLFHGTVSDFTKFERERANPESDFGAGFYFTNTPEDVAHNYATAAGPDLDSKITRRAEQIESELLDKDEAGVDVSAVARAQAEKEFKAHEGATVPVFLKLKNPLVLGTREEPYWESRDINKFISAIQKQANERGDSSGIDVGKLPYLEGGKASEVIEAVKKSEATAYAEDENGNMIQSEVIRRALEKMGYDGIIDHTVDDKFGTGSKYKQMAGMNPDTVHYVAFRPTQIKSAIGNRGTFSLRNPDIRYMPAPEGQTPSKEPFYDTIDRALDTWQPKGTPEQLLAHLGKTKGTKEQAAWIGLDDFLKDKKSVTKDDVRKFVRDNAVQVKDVTLGNAGGSQYKLDQYETHAEALELAAQKWRSIDPERAQKYSEDAAYERRKVEAERARIAEGGKLAGSTKYENYQLPGGQNYRETLLTLPSKTPDLHNAWLAQTGDKYQYHAPGGKALSPEFETERDAFNWKDGIEINHPAPFKSGHFNEPNILAHVRYNEREVPRDQAHVADIEQRIEGAINAKPYSLGSGAAESAVRRGAITPGEARAWSEARGMRNDYNPAGGKKGSRMLFLEEIQSDWHQKGRQQGYQEPETPEAAAARAKEERAAEAEYQRAVEAHESLLRIVEGGGVSQRFVDNLARAREARSEAGSHLDRLMQARKSLGAQVPDAPFKTSWPALAMKRMIRLAAEKGFDKIGWTTGEQQAERYDLSKQISRVTLSQTSGKEFLTAHDLNGRRVLDTEVKSPQDIADHIGKDAAEKLASLPFKPAGTENSNGIIVQSPQKELRGLDLKVGGEGMKGFYDKILPGVAAELGKKFGAKVGQSTISTREPNGVEREGENVPVHSLDITPAMKESALQGMPLFMPNIASPSEHLDAFNQRDVKRAMAKPGWAIVTGTKEADGPHTSAANVAANAALEQELKDRGLSYRQVTGSYKGVDQGPSFLVTGLPQRSAIALAKKYGQESVLTNKGFVYQDGTYNEMKPSKTIVGPEALKQDGYTVLPDGTPISAQVDWNKRQVLESQPYRDIARNLTPEEAQGLRNDTAKNMMDVWNELPPKEEFQAAVKMGMSKKGWYERAGRAIRDIFGSDSERFVSLLAATSPRQSVQLNLHMAAELWKEWDEAGRPTDEPTLRELVEPAVNLSARVNNAIRALRGEPLEDLPVTRGDGDSELSGYKVESFRKNLMGDLHAVTNDSWMAQFAGIPQAKFATKAGYLAMSAKIRDVAKSLGLHPAEVQETIWAFFKTLVENTHVDTPAAAVLDALTNAQIEATPEFATELLSNPRVRKYLAERYGASALPPVSLHGAAPVRHSGPTSLAKAAVEGTRGSKGVLGRLAKRAQDIVNPLPEAPF